MLYIKNHKTGESTMLVRDVCYKHPDWVHAQMGTDSESELQISLDQLSDEEYESVPGQSDCCGIFFPVGADQ